LFIETINSLSQANQQLHKIHSQKRKKKKIRSRKTFEFRPKKESYAYSAAAATEKKKGKKETTQQQNAPPPPAKMLLNFWVWLCYLLLSLSLSFWRLSAKSRNQKREPVFRSWILFYSFLFSSSPFFEFAFLVGICWYRRWLVARGEVIRSIGGIHDRK
jgi:hypothetical protein